MNPCLVRLLNTGWKFDYIQVRILRLFPFHLDP